MPQDNVWFVFALAMIALAVIVVTGVIEYRAYRWRNDFKKHNQAHPWKWDNDRYDGEV